MIQKAASDFATGVVGFLRGIKWLMARPGVLALLLVPWTLGLAAFAGGLWAFWTFGESWVSTLVLGWFASWGESVFFEVAYFLVKALMWFSVLLLCLVLAAVAIGILSSPIYEYISQKIEAEILGPAKISTPWRRMPQLIIGEVGKAILVIFIPLIMILIPGVNILAGIVAAFMLGWDYYDYPLARRGWSFRERWTFVRNEFWTVMGFGFWLTIPVLQILFIPMAIAGGTILNLEALQRRELALPADSSIKDRI